MDGSSDGHQLGNLFFGFSGRVNRAKYWPFLLIGVIVALICVGLVYTLG